MSLVMPTKNPRRGPYCGAPTPMPEPSRISYFLSARFTTSNRTSNPGARDFQDIMVDGRPLYRRVAEHAAAHWNEHHNLMFVVGATYPAEMGELRRAHPEIGFLVPGIGAQGGDLDATLAAGLDARGAGLLLNSSRALIYAGGGAAAAIRAEAEALRAAINRRRASLGGRDSSSRPQNVAGSST